MQLGGKMPLKMKLKLKRVCNVAKQQASLAQLRAVANQSICGIFLQPVWLLLLLLGIIVALHQATNMKHEHHQRHFNARLAAKL